MAEGGRRKSPSSNFSLWHRPNVLFFSGNRGCSSKNAKLVDKNPLFWDNFRAKLAFWAQIIFCVINLQPYVEKLQLSPPPPCPGCFPTFQAPTPLAGADYTGAAGKLGQKWYFAPTSSSGTFFCSEFKYYLESTAHGHRFIAVCDVWHFLYTVHCNSKNCCIQQLVWLPTLIGSLVICSILVFVLWTTVSFCMWFIIFWLIDWLESLCFPWTFQT